MRGPTSGSPDLGRVLVGERVKSAGGKTPDRGYGAGESLASVESRIIKIVKC